MKTPLDFAISSGHFFAVKTLLENGATISKMFEACISLVSIFDESNDPYDPDESNDINQHNIYVNNEGHQVDIEEFYKIMEVLMIHGLFPPIDDYSDEKYIDNERLLDLLMRYFPNQIDIKKLCEEVSYHLGLDGLSTIKYHLGVISINDTVVENLVSFIKRKLGNSLDEHKKAADFLDMTLVEFSKRSLSTSCYHKSFFSDVEKWGKILPQMVISNSTIDDFSKWSISDYRKNYDIIVRQFLKLFDKGVLVPEDENGVMKIEEIRKKIKFFMIREDLDEFADDWIYAVVDKLIDGKK